MSDYFIWRVFYLLFVIALAILFVTSEASWIKVLCLVLISVLTVNMAWTRADLAALADEHKKHGKL